MSAPETEHSWQPIKTAPELERIMVAGWQLRHGNCAGYWWWDEDAVHDGKAIHKPYATLWARIVLPPFPPAPDGAA